MRKSKTFRPDQIGSYFRMEWLSLALVTVSGLIYNVGLLATPWFEGRLAQCLADILGGNETAARMAVLVHDPFSALDRGTEDAVFANLQSYAKDKVVFLISHRLYHFPQLQKVIFMEDGKTTVGTHAELMASEPVYRQLYESQTGGEPA